MFRRGNDDVFRADALHQLPWLRHGFGTRLNPSWPVSDQIATAKQIHSDRVLRVESPGLQGEGDALISTQPGIDLAIRTADCLPILIADPLNRAVAAIHAGWRGVVSGIASKTVDAMCLEFNSKPEDLVVAIGPGIGACCFEVGPDVAVQFGREGRVKIDLVQTICRQLGRSGVNASQISTSHLCSCCKPEMFESFRRDREAAGRMVSLIGLLGLE